ncbi:MAG: hypothetical protein O9333_02540 [Beijerinckiaceae bacterium]|jgi:hypothetical protein|nr:hypothetical protein [Beijerinckiaceae bacterium]
MRFTRACLALALVAASPAAATAQTRQVTVTFPPGAPGSVSAGLSDRMLVDACRANAAPLYGVSGAAIRLPGRIRPDGQGGFRLDGTVNKGAEGVKKLRCLYRADRRFSHVMAVTPDGE